MKKKPEKVMELLLSIAQNMEDCGEVFSTYDVNSSSALKIFSEKVKELEVKGDSFIHDTIIELNSTFITSIEQEDILLLAEQMDEVVDGMEECAAYFYMYALKDPDDFMTDFQVQIGHCTRELSQAISLLVAHDLTAIKDHTINVKSYEELCDQVERKAIRRLFKKYSDPIKIIQFKDLYEMLENVVDNCKYVAKSLDTIVMKNL